MNSFEGNVFLSFRCIHIEGNLVLSMEEKHHWVDNFRVSEKDGIAAEQGFRFGSRNKDLELRIGQLGVLEGNLLEAFSFIGCFRVCL